MKLYFFLDFFYGDYIGVLYYFFKYFDFFLNIFFINQFKIKLHLI